MPDIQVEVSYVGDGKNIAVISASGFIDTTTAPELEKKQKFRGNLAVEIPDKLRLVSSGAFGRKLFDLISVGKSFLLHVPSEQKVFYEQEGMEVESLPFSVSPNDITKELFIPEDWDRIDLADVKLIC